jgi:flagellum-specific peptidoglycan hydrolase FlgJ
MRQDIFFSTYGPAAQAVCHGTGLCASICLAQAALESAWGLSALTSQDNNFFGIKAGKTWKGAKVTRLTSEFLNDKWVKVPADFRKYATPEDSFRDRVQLFRNMARYHRLFVKDDAETEARLIQACGYATDPDYANKLIRVIRQYKLTRFDS